ncbi:hypothetical protein EZ428_03890 [Pedobacter frigiditerrae]|uniref:Uncharacterized protein n=1 Tax=Pedobacter frigiditerrae TaxID=2530452 RepID=A0A4R0N3H7_9SPHI|nr:hypothetical protein [Pedobacter frigiditerrae]TCC93923.1 hypothetical protein EZ428_03890 [Pedobacter frigiditerrae]
MKYLLDFHTQYSQFYIADKFTYQQTDGDFWNEDAYNDGLGSKDGILGVGTECYGPMKGELNTLSEENLNVDFANYDHIVEGSIEIKSGILQILDCPTSTIQLEVNLLPNWYMERIYSSNLESVYGDEGNDYYMIEIWPQPKANKKVLKRLS